VGAHSATVDNNGAAQAPKAGFVSVSARHYRFIFDPSARYTITQPTQPDDQFDYNKLPGFSDCGTFDLSQDGAMFGWRWRLDTNPKRLEIVDYANNAGTHLYPSTPLLTLSEADLAAEEPLSYDVSIGGAGNSRYLFRIHGTINGRAVDVSAQQPRRCATTSPTATKWASGFYFGGTSTSPSVITGWIDEAA
jgi:hypothetical protein